MGKRGPKPKPTKLKLITGSRVTNHNEPQPAALTPKCPAWLDPEAKRKWRVLVPELSRLGILTIVDGDALAAYCQAWAEFRQATETLQREGRYVTVGGGVKVGKDGSSVTLTGQPQPHPAIAQQRSAWKAVKDFAALFGLDPSSRSRIQVPDRADDRDTFDDFVNGNQQKA